MFARVRRVGAGFASLAGLRTELFAIELREQLQLWLRTALLLLAVVVLGCIGLAFTAVFITVVFWDSQPLIALGVFAALFLGAAALCARQVSVAFATAPKPFSATIAEFRRDAQVLQRTGAPADPASYPPAGPVPPYPPSGPVPPYPPAGPAPSHPSTGPVPPPPAGPVPPSQP